MLIINILTSIVPRADADEQDAESINTTNRDP